MRYRRLLCAAKHTSAAPLEGEREIRSFFHAAPQRRRPRESWHWFCFQRARRHHDVGSRPELPQRRYIMATASAVAATPSGDKRFKMLDVTMKRHPFRQDRLIEVLHKAQELFGYLEDRRAVLRRRGPETAAEPRLRRRDVLSFLHVHAARASTPASSAPGPPATSRGPTACSRPSKERPGSRPARRRPTAGSRCGTARCLGACGLAPVVVYDGEVRRQPGDRNRPLERLKGWAGHGSR